MIGAIKGDDRDDDERGAIGSALYLTEALTELGRGGTFLERLDAGELQTVKDASSSKLLASGEAVFVQGDPHKGIYLIESGCVRTYYTGPSGREITLALWTSGHFVGGPEIFGGGSHMWSATTVTDANVRYLSGPAIRNLIERIPSFAICIIDGLVAKGKCYSALVQMLGTRSVVERLAQLLLILGRLQGRRQGAEIVIDRNITFEQIANIVGSTRQWVTNTLKRFQERGLISVDRTSIVIHRPDDLGGEV